MQYEIILNSRTYSVDYRWIARPAYISEALCDRVRDLMYLLERAGNLTDEDYLRNIFFFADESGGVLVRGGYSATTDKFGRQIYSVEGIVCPAAQLRSFWYALPVLIAWMTQCPLFRDTWVYGMAEETDLSGLKVDIAELGEELQSRYFPLRLFRETPESIWTAFPEASRQKRRRESIHRGRLNRCSSLLLPGRSLLRRLRSGMTHTGSR